MVALIHSRSFVGSGSGGGGGCDDMRRRYGATIWCDDMHRRYGEPICKAGKQKRPRACCSWPLMVYFCDSLLLFSDPLYYLPHISGNNPSNKILELY